MNGMKQLNRFAAIGLLAMIAFYSKQLPAGIATTGKPIDANPKQPKDVILATNNTAFENANTQLRCWQEGKLLFEEINFEKASLKGAANLMKFEQKSKKQGLYLMQLGNAMCMYKEK